MEKIRPQLETRKLQMGKLTGKGKHTGKVGNHPHTYFKNINVESNQGRVMGDNRLEMAWEELNNMRQDVCTFLLKSV